jgi:hypothetical protein
MRAAALLTVFFIPAAAVAQDTPTPTTQPPRVGGKPIVQVKPSAPAGCKLVGTVRGTKLWAGDCAPTEQLRPTTNTGDETSSAPLADRAAGAIPKGQQ